MLFILIFLKSFNRKQVDSTTKTQGVTENERKLEDVTEVKGSKRKGFGKTDDGN